jgi:hypothetical protein
MKRTMLFFEVLHWRNLLTCFFILSLFPHTPVSAQPNVRMQASKTSILVGEQIVLHLELLCPLTEKVRFPFIGDTLSKGIEVLQQSEVDTLFPEGDIAHQLLIQEFVITSFDSGPQLIPPLTFYLKTDSVQTRPILIEVGTVAVEEETDFRDIKGPMKVRFSLLEWVLDNWKWLLGLYALIGAVLLYLKLFYKKKKTTNTIEKEVEVAVPAHELALDQLQRIVEQKLWQQGELKRYHSALTEVIRSYIENRFSIAALEQTSDELFGHLRYVDLSEVNRMRLRQLLLLADMVKFAKEKPDAAANELSMQNAISFVNETKWVAPISTGTIAEK